MDPKIFSRLVRFSSMGSWGGSLRVRHLSSRADVSRSALHHADHYKALQDMLPHVEFSTNRYERERHGRGESYHPVAAPDLVASPSSVEDVQAIIRHCVRHRIPVIPFGAGTSVEGHVSALQGGLSLDMTAFQSIELNTNEDGLPSPYAVVGAGVTRMQFNQALRATGMQFVVDPGADATIGGMVATRASGTTTVRYGTMRDNILELECVLPNEDATIVHAGTKALKNSAGYDLVSLLCGSEGTLGVITSITCKLHPIPDHVVAAICGFESLHQAAEAVAVLKLSEIPLFRCELLDSTSIQAFNAYNKDKPRLAMPVKPTLFLEFQGPSEESLKEHVSITESICVDDFGGSSFTFTSSGADQEEERKSLWTARHNLLYASIAFRPGATHAILTDACVPLPSLASLIGETVKDVQREGVVGPCFGHAMDGNFHCILPVKDDESPEYMAKLHRINDDLIRRTLEAGGTCTGEHGVGYGKIQYLECQYGPGAVQMMQGIKKSLDPKNIMNPGKVVPS